MTVRALGLVGVVHDGEPIRLPKAARRIIAILVAAGPDGLSADQLASEIWGDDLTSTWEANLRMAISRMRRAMPVETIASGNRHYALKLANDEVDVWQLLDHAAVDVASFEEARLLALLTDSPFPDPVDSRLVDRCIQTVTAARAELIERLARDQHLDRATPLLLTRTGQLALTTWDETLIEAIVKLHAVAISPGAALQILSAATERLEHELAAPVGPRLQALGSQLAERDVQQDTTGRDLPITPPLFLGPQAAPPPASLVDRQDLLQSVLDKLGDRGVVLTGESGAGKTLVANSVAAERHAAGNHVLWLVGQRGATASFGPIVTVFPALIHTLTTDRPGNDLGLTQTRRWSDVQTHLLSKFADRGVTVVVDDAQWLDDQSAQLVEFLARSMGAEGFEFLVVGRADGDARSWLDTADRLKRSGLGAVTVPQFSRDELVGLVGLIHPRSTSLQRHELADLLVTRRAALPVIAAEIIASADSETLTLPTLDFATNRWTDALWTSAVSTETATIASAAALVGTTWSFQEVLAITSSEADDLADAVDELLDHDLVIAEARPDLFSFRHVLIQEAFGSRINAKQRRSLHLASAEIAAANGAVHKRARHLIAAGPTVDTPMVVAAVIDSATTHLERSSFLEAVQAFALADRIDPTCLDAPLLGKYLHAIVRSGGDGTDTRQRAFEGARDLDDPALMLSVLLDGGDPGELLEAGADRLVLLDQIPRERLSRADRLRIDHVRCRELGLAGQHENARELYAATEAETPDEQAAAWLGLWTSLMGTPPDTWPPAQVEPRDVTDPVDRARLRNTVCERALILGDRNTFDAELAFLEREPATESHPTRRWGLHLLQSLRSFLDGDLTDAHGGAERALEIGIDSGLGGAFPARMAQLFAQHWVRSAHHDLLPVLDGAAPDLRSSVLATAAHAVAMRCEAARIDEARQLTAMVLDSLGRTSLAIHASVAVLFAEAAGDLRPEQRQQLFAILGPHAGSAVLVGAGIAHLGPANRALAQLSTDPEQTVSLLATSVEEADRWQLPIWSVRCRLDLFEATENQDVHRAAHELATGTELAEAFFAGQSR